MLRHRTITNRHARTRILATRSSSRPLAASLHRLGRSLGTLPGRIRLAAALSRSRRRLHLLDDHLLRDVGLTRAEAMSEAAKSVWDAPTHWQE
jgi:uncharacterized protein YjiS (DUF1127 family)